LLLGGLDIRGPQDDENDLRKETRISSQDNSLLRRPIARQASLIIKIEGARGFGGDALALKGGLGEDEHLRGLGHLQLFQQGGQVPVGRIITQPQLPVFDPFAQTFYRPFGFGLAVMDEVKKGLVRTPNLNLASYI
jgi:hypothetical protein